MNLAGSSVTVGLNPGMIFAGIFIVLVLLLFTIKRR
jgi:hypothetical protein